MDGPLDLNKKRVIPEVTYSVVENFGWDARDKKQRKLGTITQLQFLDLKAEEAGKLSRAALLEELNSERGHNPTNIGRAQKLLGSEQQESSSAEKTARSRLFHNFIEYSLHSSSKDDI